MVLLYFHWIGFIRTELSSLNIIELYLLLNAYVKLHRKSFHAEHTYLKVCVNGILFSPVYLESSL